MKAFIFSATSNLLMKSVKIARLTTQAQGQQTEDTVHISSFAIIKNENGLLLAKRIRPEFTAGKWTLPSSIINYGEDPKSAVKRIVKEQLGTEPKGVRLLDVFSFGERHWDLCFVYEVSIDEVGSVSPDIEKAAYFDRSNLPSDFRTDHLEILQGLSSRI